MLRSVSPWKQSVLDMNNLRPEPWFRYSPLIRLGYSFIKTRLGIRIYRKIMNIIYTKQLIKISCLYGTCMYVNTIRVVL